jgi:hypothetical protein
MEKQVIGTKGITWQLRRAVLSSDYLSFAKIDDDTDYVMDYIPLHEITAVTISEKEADAVLHAFTEQASMGTYWPCLNLCIYMSTSSHAACTVCLSVPVTCRVLSDANDIPDRQDGLALHLQVVITDTFVTI